MMVSERRAARLDPRAMINFPSSFGRQPHAAPGVKSSPLMPRVSFGIWKSPESFEADGWLMALCFMLYWISSLLLFFLFFLYPERPCEKYFFSMISPLVARAALRHQNSNHIWQSVFIKIPQLPTVWEQQSLSNTSILHQACLNLHSKFVLLARCLVEFYPISSSNKPDIISSPLFSSLTLAEPSSLPIPIYSSLLDGWLHDFNFLMFKIHIQIIIFRKPLLSNSKVTLYWDLISINSRAQPATRWHLLVLLFTTIELWLRASMYNETRV